MASGTSTDHTGAVLSGLVAAVWLDVGRLHAAWMGVVFPRQRAPVHPVLGRWRPETVPAGVGYIAWGVLGGLALLAAYPLAVVGFAVRAQAGRLRRAAVAVGILGAGAVAAAVWGTFTAAAYLWGTPPAGTAAVAVGGGIATVSAVLAVLTARIDGRTTTLLLAYPFAVMAVSLPPVVAAFYSPSLAGIVFPNSERFAVWILDHLLSAGGAASFLRANFALAGLGHVVMWFGLSVPVGWLLGLLVTLANLARPPGRERAA